MALPHEAKADETDIEDPNKRAEIKRAFFEAGLRPEFIQAAIHASSPKAIGVVN